MKDKERDQVIYDRRKGRGVVDVSLGTRRKGRRPASFTSEIANMNTNEIVLKLHKKRKGRSSSWFKEKGGDGSNSVFFLSLMIFHTSIWIPCEWRISRMEKNLLSAIWSYFFISNMGPAFLMGHPGNRPTDACGQVLDQSLERRDERILEVWFIEVSITWNL